MAINVAEIRKPELDDALAFARSLGSELEAGQVITSRSLIARDGAKIVGTVLCVHDLEGGSVLEVSLVEDCHDATLAQSLVDRVLPKLQPHGVHKCQILTRGGAEADVFWQGADWLTKINVRCQIADEGTEQHKAPDDPPSENLTAHETGEPGEPGGGDDVVDSAA